MLGVGEFGVPIVNPEEFGVDEVVVDVGGDFASKVVVAGSGV